MTTEQSRTREHVACQTGAAHVVAALEAADLIISQLKQTRQAFACMSRPTMRALEDARELSDTLGQLLDELVERDPGAPGEEWPDLTVHPAGCACGDPDCLASRYRPAPTR